MLVFEFYVLNRLRHLFFSHEVFPQNTLTNLVEPSMVTDRQFIVVGYFELVFIDAKNKLNVPFTAHTRIITNRVSLPLAAHAILMNALPLPKLTAITFEFLAIMFRITFLHIILAATKLL